MHTVLDLDLDVFSWPIVHWPQTQDRPSDEEHTVASAEDVKYFLEVQCGLSPSQVVPGQEFTDHDEAFVVWRRWIETGLIQRPFNVIHVDAHADMGMGDPGYVYLMADLLALPANQRIAASHPRGSRACHGGRDPVRPGRHDTLAVRHW